MSRGHGCHIENCPYYGHNFSQWDRPWKRHHPDEKSDNCPMPLQEAKKEPDKEPDNPVTYAYPYQDQDAMWS